MEPAGQVLNLIRGGMDLNSVESDRTTRSCCFSTSLDTRLISKSILDSKAEVADGSRYNSLVAHGPSPLVDLSWKCRNDRTVGILVPSLYSISS